MKNHSAALNVTRICNLNFDTFFLLVLIEVSIPNLGLLRNVLTKQAWASGLVNQGHLGTPKHCS